MSNPRRAKRGERNLFCPFYTACLDYALQKGWPGWSCSRCPHQGEHVPPPPGEESGCLRLLLEIFRLELERRQKPTPMSRALEAEGITPERLTRALRDELMCDDPEIRTEALRDLQRILG